MPFYKSIRCLILALGLSLGALAFAAPQKLDQIAVIVDDQAILESEVQQS